VNETLEGRKLGKYRILTLLNRGGMAEVYLAEHELLKNRAALKLLPSESAVHRDMVERFLREARAAAGLNHPNIIKIHDVGEDDGVYYLAMDFIDGPTLADRMREQGGAFPEDTILEVSGQVLAALEEAHGNGVIHRDIKPQNIMLDRRGNAVVLDFGIAKATYESELTTVGAFMGTVRYASPEQARGLVVDARSDLYSWGAVMYEMATGRPLFQGQDPTTIMYQHVNEPPSDPEKWNPRLSPALAARILKALKKKPEDRFASAGEMSTSLREVSSGRDLAETILPLETSPSGDPAASVIPAGKEGTAVVFPGEILEKEPASWPARGGVLEDADPMDAGLKGSVPGGRKRVRSRLPGHLPWIGIGAVVLLLLAGAFWWIMGTSPAVVEPHVRVWTDRQVYRVGDPLSVHFRAEQDCYLFLFHRSADGHIQCIFPLEGNSDNFVRSGITHTIPNPAYGFELLIQPPPGEESIKALVVTRPEEAARLRNLPMTGHLEEAGRLADVAAYRVVE